MFIAPDLKSFFLRTAVAKGVCLACALFALWQVTMGMKTYFSYMSMVNEPQPSLTAMKQNSNPAEERKYLQTPLFGVYVPKNLNDGDVKRSMLNLKVVGVMFAARESDSQVIIRNENGHEQLFRVGDHLAGGVLIKRITLDGVLVVHNGELESLSLPKNELIFEPPSKKSLLDQK